MLIPRCASTRLVRGGATKDPVLAGRRLGESVLDAPVRTGLVGAPGRTVARRLGTGERHHDDQCRGSGRVGVDAAYHDVAVRGRTHVMGEPPDLVGGVA